MSLMLSPIPTVAREAPSMKLPISPLAGEMSGRTEGGAVPPTFQISQHGAKERRSRSIVSSRHQLKLGRRQ
ncbi:hypothetical protein NKJ33_31245, partial [Mesorhizobium sp. M0155]